MKHIVLIALIGGIVALYCGLPEKSPELPQNIPAVVVSLADKIMAAGGIAQ